jgi:putative transcriptional regulator
MDENTFNDLIASVREAGAIKRGEQNPSREFVMTPPRVRRIRQMTNLTQDTFARFLNISVATLQNWEQGRRQPTGAAKALLHALESDPENVIKALHPEIVEKENNRARKASRKAKR